MFKFVFDPADNPPFTVKIAGEVAMRAIFETWREQIVAGHLSEAGLMAIRSRLTASNEFEPGGPRDGMTLDVEEALARLRGCDPPAWTRAPDDVGGLD